MTVLARAPVANGMREETLPSRPRWATKPLGWALLAAIAYVPPFLSSPGDVAADTKQYLYLDPSRLLARAPYMWDDHIGLGTVTHQTIGYLFPMGPFFRAFDLLGVPDWVAQRLWLGSIVLAAGAGVLYLFRTLGMSGPGVVAGALVYMLSPYSLDYAARISVILLPWAALGFLIGLTDKALRDGGWRYPALFALLVQVVGGVNATALMFAGLGPVLWIAWEVVGSRGVYWRRALAMTAKIGVLTAITSAWWIAGLSLQSGYGLNVLDYTETVEAVARTSSPNELLRGLGYWFFYGQDKLGPWIEAAESYTQSPLRIVVGYAIPALALVAAVLVRWRHRLFCVLLLGVGVVLGVGAFPYDDPSPLGALFKAWAEESSAGLAMRSTARVTPLVVLAIAMLVGAGTNAAARWMYTRGRAAAGGDRRGAGAVSARGVGVGYAALLPAALVVVLVVVDFPALWDGTYYGENLQRDEDVPAYWQEAIRRLDERGESTRILEVPGADFASYRWGNTVDPITPGLTNRPYVARELIPWGSPASADLVNAFDRRLQEGVADPRGIAAIARLLDVGDIVARYDIQHERYDLVRPRFLARVLDHAGDVGEPERFGAALDEPGSRYPRIDEELLASPPNEAGRAPVEVSTVADPRPIVRAEPADGPLIVEADGEGLVDLADVGLLDQQRVILYAATFAGSPEELRANVDRDAVLVVTDTNRRRARRWSTVLDNTGYTEQVGEAPLEKASGDARLDVFPDQGDDTGTLTVTDQGDDVVSVRASSYGNPISFTPEDRAARAMDGDLRTAWRTAAFDEAIGERIVISLPEPIAPGEVELVQPISGPRDRFVTEVELRFDGADPMRVALDDRSRVPAGQPVDIGDRRFSELSVEITDLNVGDQAIHRGAPPVGFAEIRLRDDHGDPIRVEETVVMPTFLLATAGKDSLAHALVYVMARERQLDVPPRSSPEASITRRFDVPTDRTFALTGDARVNAEADAAVVDALLGAPTDPSSGGIRSTASETLAGCIRCRPSVAIDGDAATAWRTPLVGITGQWLQYEVGEPIAVDGLDLQVVADGRHSVPTRLRVEVDGRGQDVEVPPIADVLDDGENATAAVRLDLEPMRGRTVRVTVLEAREVRSREYHSEAELALPVGIAELGIDGLTAPPVPRTVPDECRDDLVAVDGEQLSVRLVGALAAAEAGEALSVETCDRDLTLTAGTHTITTAHGNDVGVEVDRLVLASEAGGDAMAVEAGRVVGLPPEPPPAPDVTVDDHGAVSYDATVDSATHPYWLVLGESRSDGWQATADDTGDLGTPTLVDGFANGWLVENPNDEPAAVSLEWTPQRRVWIAIAISLAAALACIAIVAVARRRRRPAARRIDGDAELDLSAPRASRTIDVRTHVATIVTAAAVAGVAIGLWAGIVAGGVVTVLLAWSRARLVIGLLAALLVAGVGAYMATAQLRNDYPPIFEWPALFPRATNPAWLALILVAAVALVDWVRSRPPWPIPRREGSQ